MLVSYGGILPRPMSELRMIWFLLHGELELLHFCLESKLSVLDSVALVLSLHDVYHSLSESALSAASLFPSQWKVQVLKVSETLW